MIRMHYRFTGRVQGVGFRYTAFRAATARRLTGYVRNEDDGSVTMELQGEGGDIASALREIGNHSWIRIDEIDPKSMPLVPNEGGFRVLGYGI